LALLKDEFLSISVRHIESVFGEQKSLFKAYGILKEQFREAHSIHHKDAKLKAPRAKRDVGLSMSHRGRPILKELRKAQRKEEGEASKYQKVQDSELLEQENLRQAKRMDEMGECLCCFDDFPINRMTSCSGDTVHFFCLSCAKKYAEGEMGMGRIKLVCFADSNCGGTFARGQLQRFLGETSFERFEHMQQQHELAAAGLDFLSECPFCDFKAECLPVKVDKEFRCENPKCRKVSCRLCQAETHIPLSCEEFRKDSKLSLRHKVEEAMSAALIRNCNKCKHPFVKDHGCNKMTCTRCGNVQCYVCSKDVKDYQHFRDSHIGGGTNGTCPLHDNVEERHEQEVKKAADEAKAKVLAEDPNVSDADLMIRVSDRVERAEQSRRGRAQVEAAHIGGVLANGPPMLHRPREPQPVLGHLPRYRPGFPPP
jgi:TRIAD3 protein (E3 ubiquitin-protein ligase RNF216)